MEMEPEVVSVEMECLDGGNAGKEVDGGNGREEVDVGSGHEETAGGNGQEEMEATDCRNSRSVGGKSRRAKHKCPFTACNASVIHLPRHMKQVHGWNKNDSAAVLGTFDLRNGKPLVKKREHPRKVCPKHKCGAIVRRIHNHLAQVHKMKRGSNEYLKLVKKAENYLPPVIDISSSDQSSVDSDGLDQPGTLQKMKKPSSSRKVYQSVYDSEDSEDYNSFLSSVVKSGDKRSDRDGDDRGHDEGECGGDVDGDSGDEDGNGGFSGNCSYNAFSGGNKKGNCEDVEDYVGGDIEKRDDDNDGDNYGECSGDRVDCDIGGKCGNVRNEGNDDGGDKGGDVENIGNDGDGDHDVDRDVGNDDGSYIDGDSGNSSGQVSSISIDDKVTLSNFKDWLGGPDGGRKDEKCARQCMRQVEMVMKFITPNAPSISSLLSKSLLRDKWLRIIEEEKKPGTVKSYLGSLNQFFIYMRTECSARFDEMNVNEGKLVSLSEQVKLWARSSRKMAQNRFWEKRVEDFETLKTPEEVKQFDISEVARKAVKVLGEFQTDPDVSVVSQAEYTIVRDYLMTLICINNGSRSGPIANMTMEEFQNATQQDDCYVVRVKKHKTFTTHGPAHLVLSSSIHNYMKVFIEKLRRCIPDVNACQPIVFLSYRGTPLDSSQVGAQIGSCWGKVFGKKASMGGATSFRKAAVSAVHECNEEMRGDLADLMVHNKTTADKYYLLKNKGKSAVKTSKELSRIMRDGSEKTESSDGVEKEENKDQEPPEKDAATSSVVSCPRHKWSSEETDLLKQLFATQIQMKKVSMEDIRELCKGQQFLEKIPPSKIRDKVRTLFKLGESSLPPQEKESTEEKLKRFGMPIASACKEKGSKDTKERPSEDNEEEESREDGEEESSQYSRPSSSSDVVPPSSRSRGGQDRLFSDMEMVEFRKLFSAVIHSDKPITTKVAVSMLKKNKSLKHLTKRFTNQQIYDKLRTERKIAKREKQKK